MLKGASAVVAALALTLAGCGDGDDEVTPEETPAEEEPAEEPEEPTDEEEPEVPEIDRPGRDDVLDIGYVLPESGPLAFLGAPMITGVQMAVDEINEAGGVNGNDVTLASGDEAGDAAIAQQNAAQLINGGADAIIGAAASGMSQEIIQLLYDNEIVQCSGSNTSPAFTDQANNAFYHRTVPPDEAVTPVIVDTLLGDGHQNVAIAARADDYGVALADLVADGGQHRDQVARPGPRLRHPGDRAGRPEDRPSEHPVAAGDRTSRRPARGCAAAPSPAARRQLAGQRVLLDPARRMADRP
jgi:branched-chain amino acid transport system substrate-binding protein